MIQCQRRWGETLTWMSKLCFAFEISKTILASFAALLRKAAQLKSLKTLVENSWLASFLCCRHLAPLTAKIPSPNRSLIMSIIIHFGQVQEVEK